MFDMLTLDGLYTLHHQLSLEHAAHHARLFTRGPDGRATPTMDVFSDTWQQIAAHQAEIWETAEAVYREIARREASRV